MGASVGGSPGGGNRKKSLDAEINLVPFIDLLSMCICFLLITAVWVEIGALQVKQSHGTEAAASTKKDIELDVRFEGSKSLVLQAKRGSSLVKKVLVADATIEGFHAKVSQSVASLIGSLKDTRISAAMLTPGKDVSYGNLVSVMDILRKHQIVNLGVVPIRGK